jgi:hypothetical protein
MKLTDQIVPLAIASVLGANVMTMSLMNFFEIETKYISPLYLFCALAVTALLFNRIPEPPALARRVHILCLAFGIILFLPRFPYLIEGLLGYSVNMYGDDSQHLQMMSSLAHTPAFPPKSTFDNSRFLSYYYAPWMLGAAIYASGIVSTVKEALGLSVLVYCTLFSYAAVYGSRIALKDARLQTIFLVLAILFGGFDFFYWLSNLTVIPQHSEWWALEFGFTIQYSNFFTLVLWVQQHLLAAVAILYALLLATSRGAPLRILAGVLLLSGFFSSPFVCLGGIPLFGWYFIQARLLTSLTIIVPTFLVLSVPLWWIFLGKAAPVGFKLFGPLSPFWMEHKKAAFLVFLLIVTLELFPLLAASSVSITRDRKPSRAILLLLTGLFLLSTFFFEFSLGSNYAMRGSIVPILTLTYLATPTISIWLRHVRSIPFRILVTGYLLGGILEYAEFWRGSMIAFAQSNTQFNVAVLRFNEGQSRATGADLARLAEGSDGAWYLIERARPRKEHIDEDDVLSMGSDNPYRATASKFLDFHRHRQYESGR